MSLFESVKAIIDRARSAPQRYNDGEIDWSTVEAEEAAAEKAKRGLAEENARTARQQQLEGAVREREEAATRARDDSTRRELVNAPWRKRIAELHATDLPESAPELLSLLPTEDLRVLSTAHAAIQAVDARMKERVMRWVAASEEVKKHRARIGEQPTSRDAGPVSRWRGDARHAERTAVERIVKTIHEPGMTWAGLQRASTIHRDHLVEIAAHVAAAGGPDLRPRSLTMAEAKKLRDLRAGSTAVSAAVDGARSVFLSASRAGNWDATQQSKNQLGKELQNQTRLATDEQDFLARLEAENVDLEGVEAQSV